MSVNLSRLDLEKLIETVPFFGGFSQDQVHQLLALGKVGEYSKGKVLCRDGDASNKLFLLLVGQLRVRTGDVELGHIAPVDIVGEMGLVTGMPRSATVEAVSNIRLITIGKEDFDRVVLKNEALAAKIYKNMLESLCYRMRENNVNLVKLQLKSGQEIGSSLV